MKLYPEKETIIIAAYIPDLYPVKNLFHHEIYSKKEVTFQSVKLTIDKVHGRSSRHECIGFAIHLLGDIWWEQHVRYIFKGLPLFFRRCVETSWGMTYLREMFPEEGDYLYNLIKSNKLKIIEIVRRLLGKEINENELIVEINETAEHYKSPRIRFRASIPKIQEYHEIIYEKFDLDDLLGYISKGIDFLELSVSL